jgi:hypothetical protein
MRDAKTGERRGAGFAIPLAGYVLFLCSFFANYNAKYSNDLKAAVTLVTFAALGTIQWLTRRRS